MSSVLCLLCGHCSLHLYIACPTDPKEGCVELYVCLHCVGKSLVPNTAHYANIFHTTLVSSVRWRRNHGVTWLHICTHAHTHTSMCAHIHINAHIHECVHTCVHIHMHAYINACVHTCTHQRIHEPAHSHKHKRVHQCIPARRVLPPVQLPPTSAAVCDGGLRRGRERERER